MKRYSILAIAIATVLQTQARAQSTFDFATGSHLWNIAANWTPDGVPDAPGVTAILPGPDLIATDLSIALGEDITIGVLDIQKPTGLNSGNTLITGSNALTLSGGAPSLITNRTSAAGFGATTIAVPVAIDTTLTINQESSDLLSFNGSISGGTGLTINRTGAGGGARTVVLGAANSYGGNTTLVGGDNNNAIVVRLGDVNAIPGSSTIAASNSVIFELAAGNFARTIGAGAGQLQFTGGRNGWGAIGADRLITLNGGASVNWGAATWGQLVLGSANSTHTAILTNAVVLNTASTRIVRTFDGSGAVDGRFTNVISGPGALHKQEAGVLSLANDNTYAGITILEGGMLRLDHASALGDNNLQIGSGATLGLGAADFARQLGTATGQVQLINLGSGNNQTNAGFFAHGANRTVTLTNISGGAELTWGADLFLSGGSGTPSRNLILSDSTSDATLTLNNPIDLGAGNINPSLDDIVTRNVVVRDGSADVDAVLPGVLRGTSSLSKTNDGTLALTANNEYSGGTNVMEGRLLVNNTPASAGDSGTGTGPVSVTGTATLGGTGTIAGTVTVGSGAHIAPGASIGELELGGLTIEAGSILDFELGAPNGTPGVDNDLLTVLGVTTIDGIGAVNLFNAGGLGAGTYTLIDYDTLAGSDILGFLGQTPTGPSGFTYALSDSGDTIDLAVTVAAASDADFNDDDMIDAADYVVWRKFNPTPAPDGAQGIGDANGDDDVDQDDYDEWRRNFATPSPGSGGSNSAAVPEPTTLVLASMAAMFVLRRRGRWIRK
jgi:autotransporter-associated beta strand protein